MLIDNVRLVREKVAAACAAAGRTNDVRILAAVKTIPPERILELKDCGIDLIGENRVQELVEKYLALKNRFEMHFIGALQTNKVSKVLDKVTLVHSLDRPALADELDRRARLSGTRAAALVEVNIGGEPTKSGVREADFFRLVEYAGQKEHLDIRGVMSVLPVGAPEELYERVRTLYERLQAQCPGADTLSMGMSGDYETAVKHGANLIRIGTALFGKRTYEVENNV